MDRHVNYVYFSSVLLLPDRFDVMDIIKALFDFEWKLLDQKSYLVKAWSFDKPLWA